MITSALAAGVVLALATSGGGVSAQSVESLEQKAARVAAELEAMQERSDTLNEQYLQTQQDVAELQAEQAANAQAVDAARAQLEASRSQAAGYLVEAYVGAGAHDQMAFGNSDPNEAVNQQVLLEVLKGDREQLAEGYAADQSDLEAKSDALRRSNEELSARQAEQAAVVDELESSVAEQQQLLDSTKGELAAAVKAEQERQAAAAAKAAAEAQARAAAEQAAAQRAAQTRAATPAAPRATTSTAPRSAGAPAPAPEPSAPMPASPPSSGAAGAIAAAQTMLGVPYRYGGSTPSGFDCSGLMLWSWAQVGVSLPRTSGAQRAATQRITRDQLQPGDLVFYGSPVSHVGMYVGGGQMIHSPHTGDVVKISPIDRMGGKVMSFGRIG
jgi:cell wall-associated NlpC family hydrolase